MAQHFSITDSLLDDIRTAARFADSRQEVARRVVKVLADANVDLRLSPTLEQMKRLLIEAYRASDCPTSRRRDLVPVA